MKTTDAPSLIDTSKMNPGQRAALETTEAAREEVQAESFAASLFMGRPDYAQVFPFPAQSLEDQDQGDAFLHRLGAFLDEHADPDEIDRMGEIPSAVLRGLAELGAFGIKIPAAYGGLGLSQTNYCRAAEKLGGFCGNLTALLSAHQSIGVPQPLLLYGTEEQKRKWLPRCAAGEISAFALTEPGAGSDPARLQTTATPEPDGEHFLINGEKLWCTNGTKAGIIVVMARTPVPEGGKGGARTPITAFVVEMDTPGVEVVRRCRFMGLKALYNGVIRFKNVRVPRSHIILGEGKGLRVALTTLNTGRLTLPAACVGLARRCLEISTAWARERVQWGTPIGRHGAIADKLARMAAGTFAMESAVHFVAAQVDRDKRADIRLEAAMAKLWGTERGWEIVNDTMQIRGGRGYETADSLRARGESPEPVERLFRDARINTIFEGSTEIMHLFLAREALDPHLQVGAAILNPRLPWSVRLKSAGRAALFYAGWLPRLFFPFTPLLDGAPAFRSELCGISRRSRKLARAIFYSLVRHGPALEKEQLLLARLTDIGTELFTAATTVSRSSQLAGTEPLARLACLHAFERCDHLFATLRLKSDHAGLTIAGDLIRPASDETKKTDPQA